MSDNGEDFECTPPREPKKRKRLSGIWKHFTFKDDMAHCGKQRCPRDEIPADIQQKFPSSEKEVQFLARVEEALKIQTEKMKAEHKRDLEKFVEKYSEDLEDWSE